MQGDDSKVARALKWRIMDCLMIIFVCVYYCKRLL